MNRFLELNLVSSYRNYHFKCNVKLRNFLLAAKGELPHRNWFLKLKLKFTLGDQITLPLTELSQSKLDFFFEFSIEITLHLALSIKVKHFFENVNRDKCLI